MLEELQDFERIQKCRSFPWKSYLGSHRVANSHKRTKIIEMLIIDGVVRLEGLVIFDHDANFFEQLLIEQMRWQPNLDGLGMSLLSLKYLLVRETF